MYGFVFGEDFYNEDGLVLPPSYVTDDEFPINMSKIYVKQHDSGWQICGLICKDETANYIYNWLAVHPKYGRVLGDFDSNVYADTDEGFKHFYKHHPPVASYLTAM